MSDLSKEVSSALTFTEEMEKDQMLGLVNIEESGYLSQIPAFNEFREYYGAEAVKIMRRVIRKHAGATSWLNATEAMDAVKGDFMDQFLPLTFNAMADGIQMGRQPTSVIKKYKMFDKMVELFSNSSFRADSALEAIRLSGDEDTNRGLYRFVLGAVYATGSASGYRLATEPDAGPGVGKIYDLWALSMNSVLITAYTGGVRLGKQWEEQETLQGILSATESGDH